MRGKPFHGAGPGGAGCGSAALLGLLRELGTGLRSSHFFDALCQGGVEIEQRLESYVRHMSVIHGVMQLVTAKSFGIVNLEPLPDCFVSADITKRALPGLGAMSGRLCGLRQAPLECELAPLH